MAVIYRIRSLYRTETAFVPLLFTFIWMLKRIFENEIPAALKRNDNLKLSNFVRVERKEVIKHYIEGVMLNFRSPTSLMTEELLILKLREIII